MQRSLAVIGSIICMALPPDVGSVPKAGVGPDDIISIMQPDTAYVTGTSLMPVTQPDFTVISSITDGECTIAGTVFGCTNPNRRARGQGCHRQV